MRKLLLLSIAGFAFILPSKKSIVYDAKFVEKNFKKIPAGSFHMGESDQDMPYYHQERRGVVTVEGFYIFNQEITNEMYNHFVYETRLKGDTVQYKKVLPDTLVWRIKGTYNEPYVEYYFRHPAYAHYPVVGVSYDQCLMFCEWMTQKYNADPKRKYKKVKFDLPTEEQWTWAARGGKDRSSFPWGGPYMQNTKGQWLANFKPIDQSGIIRMKFDQIDIYGKPVKNEYIVATGYGSGGSFLDNADVTAPVLSYWPNDFGLYNMSGNVEEMVKEKGISKGGSWRDTGYYLQIASREEYTDSTKVSSERGFRIIMKVEEEFAK